MKRGRVALSLRTQRSLLLSLPPAPWWQRHARLIDSFVVAALFAYNLAIIVVLSDPHGAGMLIGLTAISVALCGGYLARRRFPFLAFGAMLTVAGTQLLLNVGVMLIDVLLIGMVFSLASRFNWAKSTPVAVLVAGWLMRVRRAYTESLRQRALDLAHQRDTQAQVVAAEERARIAREIHDVVSHSLSVVVLMTDGAISRVRSDPARAEEALVTARDTGRAAMTEMRRMVGVLRSPEAVLRRTQPGMGQLEMLVEESRAAGTPVHLEVTGTPIPLSQGRELCVYRVVQEGLTNARKHGGPSLSNVDVRLTYSDQELRVTITDDGVGPDSVARSRRRARDHRDARASRRVRRGLRDQRQTWWRIRPHREAPDRRWSSSMSIRLVLVDDQEMVRAGLRLVLESRSIPK